MTREEIGAVLEEIRSWPVDDQEELVEVARDIRARRTGTYRADPQELMAIDDSERSGLATDAEVEAAFRTFRSA